MIVAAAGGAMSLWRIYCEGFHDRDFLGGLFESALEFRSLQGDPSIRKGVFGYEAGPCRIEIYQCGGKPKVKPAFEKALAEAATVRPAGLVICLDEDDAVDVADARHRARERVLRIAEATPGFDPSTLHVRTGDHHQVALVPVTWCCGDAPSVALPERQNLERLLVAALCAAHPERGPLVRAWLDSRTEPPADPSSVSKSFSWSHMAGWFPSPGGAAFFKAIWSEDQQVADALAQRMSATGIDALLAAMGVSPPWAVAPAT